MDIFKSVKFWRLFPVPIVLHALWDMPFSSIPVLILLIVIAWIFILALIRSGMAEVSRLSTNAKRDTEPEAFATEEVEETVE